METPDDSSLDATPSIDPSKLHMVSFEDSQNVKTFSCGVPELDEFLQSEEVMEYENERLGKTTLVFYKGDLAAYFTLSYGSLRLEYVKSYAGLSKIADMRIRDIPALTIGRLAVDTRYQSQGIGKYLIKYIVGLALYQENMATRLIVVQAKEDAFDFYKQLGFQFTTETKSERKLLQSRGTRTMFFDLEAL